jgi:hypothetical protein
MEGGPGPHLLKRFPTIVINADGTDRRHLVDRGTWPLWSPAGDGIAIRDGYIIDPETLVRRSYGPGSARAYSADGEHLLATGPGLLIDDRRGCGVQLVVTDFARSSPNFVAWAGTGQILIKVLPPA